MLARGTAPHEGCALDPPEAFALGMLRRCRGLLPRCARVTSVTGEGGEGVA